MEQAFEDLLRSELFLTISTSGTVQVKEADISAILKKLEIRRVPVDSVVFELDHTPTGILKKKLKNAFCQLSCLIHDEHTKANKSCDFVIVSPGAISKIILGDLKSKAPKRIDCFDQLKNSELFVGYLLTLLSEYHNVEITPEYKKIIFYVTPSTNSKTPTQQKNKNKLLKYDGVTYFPVTVGGYRNTHAIVSYSSFCDS